MDAQEHLFYGLGIVAFAVAKADGEIQTSEKRELHELMVQWSNRYASDYNVTEIIFQILEKTKPSFAEGFDEGMRYIRLGSEYLTVQLKEHFIYLIQDVARSFPPITEEEATIINRFKKEINSI